jgi:hypothetical protein
MRIVDCEQGSLAWYAARRGVATASNFHKIITPGGKPSKQAEAYRYRLLAEILLNESMDDYLGQTQWMERGKLLEDDAVSQFEFAHDVELQRIGFVTTDNGRLGCSPDRLIKTKRRASAIEVKCPSPWQHMQYLIEGPGDDYRPQVQGQLLVGEFESAIFYSYHPRCPPAEYVTHRDEAYIRTLAILLREFVEQLDATVARARALGAYVTSQQMQTPQQRAFPEAGPDPLTVIIPD